MNLVDKVVLVTGGAVRVGRAIVLEMAKAGAVICCHYNNSEAQAQNLKREVEALDGSITLFWADLSQVTETVRLAETVLEKFGQIDVLVNNAAIFFKTPLGTVTEEQWDRLLNVNLKSVFFLSQMVGKHMLQRKQGKIISIADSGAEHPFPSYLPYSISKSGVVALTRGLARALAPYVQVNCVNPGPVLMPEDFPEKDRKFAIEQTLLKREGSARDIARAVRFLAEEDYITGVCLNVDGGRAVR